MVIVLSLLLFVTVALAVWQFIQNQASRTKIMVEMNGLQTAAAVANDRTKQNESLQQEIKSERERLALVQQELSQARSDYAALLARFESEKSAADEKLQLMQNAQEQLKGSFASLSREALSLNSENFLKLAEANLQKFQQEAQGDLAKRGAAIESLIKPISETLAKVENTNKDLELKREGAYRDVLAQAVTMGKMAESLRSETGNLTKALRTPTVRGRWGEIQLKRVVELAGMLDRVDFKEQQTVDTNDGRLRPDMVVQLPGGRSIVIDAKVPLEAYLSSVEAADDGNRTVFLKSHADAIGEHVKQLGRKAYWEQFSDTPEFVVLFLAGEHFFAAALEHRPDLIEVGINNRVIIATPTTLIALLRTVAYGWRQEGVAENSQKIAELGRELYSRINGFAEHFSAVGKGLNSAVNAYDRAVGTLEGRVLVTARKFTELESTSENSEIETVESLGLTTREPRLLLSNE